MAEGITFRRVRGKTIPIKGKSSSGGQSGGKGSRVYRDGASLASQREAQKDTRAAKNSGSRKFGVAGAALMGLGFLNISNLKAGRGLAMVAGGAALLAHGKKKFNNYKKSEYRKPGKTSV